MDDNKIEKWGLHRTYGPDSGHGYVAVVIFNTKEEAVKFAEDGADEVWPEYRIIKFTGEYDD